MNRDRIRTFAYLVICVLGILVLAYVGLRYLLPLILPFVIAWGVAFATRPLSRRLNKLTKIPVKVLRPTLALLLLLSLLGLCAFLLFRLVTEAWGLLSGIGENEELLAVVSSLLNPLEGIFGSAELGGELEEYLTRALQSVVSSLLERVGQLLSSAVSFIPGILIFLLVTVIASVYFSIDLEYINDTVRRLMPKRIGAWLVKFKDNSLKVALKYARSYLLIMLITFVIMLIGLVILRVEYSLLLALVIALLDLLPVIGVGTVLIPWSIWMFICSDVRMGIGLAVLFVVHEIVRQVAEPKIVGKSLGIHPILTLVLLYGGYTLFGILGLVLLPVLAVVVNTVIVKNKTPDVEESTESDPEG